MLDDLLLRTRDVLGFYPNIPHEEGFIAIRKALDITKDQTVSTESLIELAEYVLEK